MKRARRAAFVLVVLALLGGGAAWWWREDGTTYPHALVDYDDEMGGEPNRYTDLPDGQARLAFGSPDSHELVVQWRDPDGHGWTAPETIYTDKVNTAIDSTLRAAGGTVAIIETYVPDTSKDEDIDNLSVFIVCRDLRCEVKKLSAANDEPRPSPDGSTVLFGYTYEGAILWTEDEGIHESPWEKVVPVDSGRVSYSTPVLANEGGLLTVASRARKADCDFRLLVSDPGSTALEEVATVVLPRKSGPDQTCRSYLLVDDADRIAVLSNERSWPRFWFVREGDTWRASDRKTAG